MINIVVSCANLTTEEWEPVCTVPLKPYAELYHDTPVCEEGWGVNDFEFTLPSEETLTISAAFTESNLGISFGVSAEGKSLISIYCFKKDIDIADPSVVFKTPNGVDVSILFGSATL